MNKIYISISLLASVLMANQVKAQSAITLSSAYLPQAGYSYNMATDTTPGDLTSFTVSAGSATAQNWNYASLFGNVYGTTTSFVAPSGNPGASNFPNANLASDQGGGNWAYFISGSNGLYIDGAYVNAQGSNVALDLTPNSPQLPTPFTYHDSITVVSTATGTTTYQGNQVLIKHRATRTVMSDAFGSLTTPTATYTNTLRVKTYEISSDSIFFVLFGSANYLQGIFDTTTNYSWYQNAQDAIVMSIDQNTAGNASKAQYLQTLTNGINSPKHTDFTANLYPNPASSVTYLYYENATESKVSAVIYDVTGKKITTVLNNQPQAAGKQTLTIPVSDLQLSEGLYIVQLSINGTIKTFKLNIVQ